MADLRRAERPATFRDFMDAALYGVDDGFYGSGRVRFGSRGDFSTSSTLHPVFAEVLAACMIDAWTALGRPGDFALVEVGPGDGALALGILESLRAQAPAGFACRYLLVERSVALVERQRAALRDAAWRVEWTALERLAADPITGVILSNELVDALPVHRARARDGRVEEQFVVYDGERWTSIWSEPSTPAVASYVARYAPAFFDISASPELEVGLDAARWIGDTALALGRGYLVTVDYGDLADRLYTSRRPFGTIRAFRDRQLAADPLADAGALDLTAHVNFSALVDAGADAGLARISFELQRDFCARYGLADRIARRAAKASVRERLAMKALVAPRGIGDAMRVLVQGKIPAPTNDFPRLPI